MKNASMQSAIRAKIGTSKRGGRIVRGISGATNEKYDRFGLREC